MQKPIICDEKRLSQIIISLISRLSKLSPKTRIEIGVDFDSEQCELLVTLKEKSGSCQSVEIETLKQEIKFVQENDQLTEKGMGLNLLLTKKVLEQYDGSFIILNDAPSDF